MYHITDALEENGEKYYFYHPQFFTFTLSKSRKEVAFKRSFAAKGHKSKMFETTWNGYCQHFILDSIVTLLEFSSIRRKCFELVDTTWSQNMQF